MTSLAATPNKEAPSIVEVRNLCVSFTSEGKTLRAVRNISFSLYEGKTLCLVGESGCGKSMTALALMGLLPEQGKLSADALIFEGQDLLAMEKNSKALRALRGRHMAMIFQDPMTSLNPVYRVGEQVAEALRLHLGMSKAEARQRTIELFRQVGIPSPELRIDDYPHQLSGGMRQRVMIAMALSCGPRLLIADEPTTALDVTVQKQILQLLGRLRSTCGAEKVAKKDGNSLEKSQNYGLSQEANHAPNYSANHTLHHGLNQTGAAILFITHDLGVVAQTADNVAVMYAGSIVEYAPVEALFANPKHPYTQGLMASAPTLDLERNETKQRPRLTAIKGNVPPLDALPSGCAFHNRCPKAMERCSIEEPPCVEINIYPIDIIENSCKAHTVRCWLYAK